MAGGDNMLNENFTSLEKYFRDGNLNNVLRFFFFLSKTHLDEMAQARKV